MSAPSPTRRSIWRRGAALWLPALLFFLANAAALAVYPLRFAGRARVSDAEISAARAERQALTADRLEVEGESQTIVGTRDAINRLYQDRLSTESRRLTRVIAEVKDLAARSGLTPQSISYPRQPLEEYGLRERAFVFSVQGSYADLRKFINLLELSDTFLTLEHVGLTSGGRGSELNIQLRISTLFSTVPEPPLEVS